MKLRKSFIIIALVTALCSGASVLHQKLAANDIAVKTSSLPDDLAMKKRVENRSRISTTTQFLLPVNDAPLFATVKGLPNFYGCVRYQSDWDVFDVISLYTVPTSNSQEFQKMFTDPTVPEINAVRGGVVKDGLYYTCKKTEFMGYTFVNYDGYNLETGQPEYSNSAKYPSTTMTYDAATEMIYAIVEDSGKLQLATIEFSQYGVFITPLGEMPGRWTTIACSSDGQLYGIREYFEKSNQEDVCVKSELYKINKADATQTLIGDTGMKPQFRTDATIDPRTGRMFWTVSQIDNKSYMTEVDLTTGQADYIYEFPKDQIVVGLQTSGAQAADKAPGEITDAASNFSNGSMSGTITFTAPATHYDETPATGSLTAVVSYMSSENPNPTEIARRNVQCGDAVSMDITMPSAGLYDFSIVVSNEEGPAPAVVLRGIFVGNDTPMPAKPVLTYENNVMSLIWDPVDEAVNGGYVNTSAMRYTVIRQPDNVVVAQNISETHFSEECVEPSDLTYRHYSVTAEYDGIQSAPGLSNVITMGAITPPFTADFQETDCGFTVMDANNDGISFNRQESTTIGGNWWFRINNYGTTMDDWLMSPPLRFQRGYAYKLKFKAYTASSDPETIEVKYGMGCSVADMNLTLLEPTVVQNYHGDEFELTIVPAQTGKYTIGIHGISPQNTFYLCIDDVEISMPFSPSIPEAVTDLEVTPGARGALSANIAFTAPVRYINGNEIASIKRIELRRGDDLIETFDNVVAGSKLTYTDNAVSLEGEYTYSVVSVSNDGESDPASKNVFIGTGIPVSPTNAHLSITENHGEAYLTWDNVTLNTHGGEVDPAKITYNVYTVEGPMVYELVESGISTNSYRYKAVADGEQKFMQFAIKASSPAGDSDAGLTDKKALGTPVNGMHETGKPDQLWNSSGLNAMWISTNEADTSVPTQDGDDAYFAMAGQLIDATADLISGLISLNDMKHPSLTFHLYSMGEEDHNSMTVHITDVSTGVEKLLYTTELKDLPDKEQWNRVMLSLDEYAGKIVSLRFSGELKSYSFMLMDNIYVGNLPEYDMVALNLTAPRRATTGTTYTATTRVRNEGTKDCSGYKIELFADGEVLHSWDGVPLKPNERTDVSFDIEMPVLATDPVKLYAAVIFDVDENSDNNSTAPLSVDPEISLLTAPDGLKGNFVNDVYTVSWNKPDTDNGVAMRYTETFEQCESWAQSINGWEFVDLDQSPVGGMMGVTTPGIDYGISTLAYYILDNSEEPFNRGFDAVSGHKLLASLFRFDNGPSDDWAVSPLLDGSAQTVRFFARSYWPEYPESIEVWYTTSDDATFNKDNYTLIASFPSLKSVYDEFSVDLPVGATHFAIRNCAVGAYLLLIDDISFIQDANRIPVTLISYDIYRDGVKINNMPLTQPVFTDTEVALGEHHSYVVTATYDKGVSAPSKRLDVVIGESGLETTVSSSVGIYSEGSSIVVSNAIGKCVTVSAADGKIIYRGNGSDMLRIPVDMGIYIVKAGNTVAKVLVR